MRLTSSLVMFIKVYVRLNGGSISTVNRGNKKQLKKQLNILDDLKTLGFTDFSHVQTVFGGGDGGVAAVCRDVHAVHLPNHCVLSVKVTAVRSAAHVIRTLCWRPVTEKQGGIPY